MMLLEERYPGGRKQGMEPTEEGGVREKQGESRREVPLSIIIGYASVTPPPPSREDKVLEGPSNQ